MRSSNGLPVLLTTVAAMACASQRGPVDSAMPLAPGDHVFSLRHDGRSRDFLAHVPPAAATGTATPLLLAFHGGGGEARGFRSYANLDAVADREGFIVVYPEGTGPLRNRLLTWNAGGCCGWAMQHGIDDVGFAIALIDDVAALTPIDRRRVYATGHSNGAMMAYRLAAERGDRIAAIAPVAGAMSLDTFSLSRPVSVLHIHSVDDPRALYGGGTGPPFPLTNSRVMHRPVRESLDRWIEADQCVKDPETVETRHGTVGETDEFHTATLQVWRPCAGGAEVAHWKLTGAGHGWPGGPAGLPQSIVGPETRVIDAATEVWAFVSRFSIR